MLFISTILIWKRNTHFGIVWSPRSGIRKHSATKAQRVSTQVARIKHEASCRYVFCLMTKQPAPAHAESGHLSRFKSTLDIGSYTKVKVVVLKGCAEVWGYYRTGKSNIVRHTTNGQSSVAVYSVKSRCHTTQLSSLQLTLSFYLATQYWKLFIECVVASR